MSPRVAQRWCVIERVAAMDNLYAAASRARRGKSRRPDVEDWWLDRENQLRDLQSELAEGRYRPGPYREFVIHDPKRRTISAAPFRDRVLHHALCQVLGPVLESRFIPHSFSCQPGKGTSAARECCRWLVNRHTHVLKCDVRKFFPNIDHEILIEKLSRYLRCAGILGLVRTILGSYRTGVELPAHVFPGDDWLEANARSRGLPIGNLTSQLWGNFYLDDLDHWITEIRRHGAYLRYTDDFLVFSDSRAALWEFRQEVAKRLANIRLKLAEPKSRLYASREGIPFCGFRFLPDRRPRVLGSTKRRFEARRFRMLEGAATVAVASRSIRGWYEFSREGNTEGLRRAYTRWPTRARLKRRRRRMRARGSRGLVEQRSSQQLPRVEPQRQPSR